MVIYISKLVRTCIEAYFGSLERNLQELRLEGLSKLR